MGEWYRYTPIILSILKRLKQQQLIFKMELAIDSNHISSNLIKR